MHYERMHYSGAGVGSDRPARRDIRLKKEKNAVILTKYATTYARHYYWTGALQDIATMLAIHSRLPRKQPTPPAMPTSW